ncbi:competence protein ComK [Mangrovibacillus cuniculi]|uniref:Competence protein ComK n=1 Tax=Mangrovibacillus cuniculi TaxID=2593652 RepID=A0A7S8CAV3_9BACI|nr:competence protein ComK [Mangrovibacillus cuniculi]QPC46557.1 competence protein ComK [Mangrovibacillus cuniculi]
MFTERTALKVRLEQLADSEERIIREFRQEREAIFERLRELDARDLVNQPTVDEKAVERPSKVEVTPFPVEESLTVLSEPIEKKSEEPKKASKTTTKKAAKKKKDEPVRQRTKTKELRQAVVDILQEEKESIRGAALRRAAEERTGWEIANMTAFMNLLMSKYPQIQKLDRGMYGWVTVEGAAVPVVEED